MLRLRSVVLLTWLSCLAPMMAACSSPIRVEWCTETEMNTAGFKHVPW